MKKDQKWIKFKIDSDDRILPLVENFMYSNESIGLNDIEDKIVFNELNEKEKIITIEVFFDYFDDLKYKSLCKAIDRGINSLKIKYENYIINIIDISIIENEDWSKNWKDFYKPLFIGKSFLILPEWIKDIENDNRIIIRINPGMAFGLGSHESTSLSLELMEKLDFNKKTVFDIGCGSGILSIAALRLGAEEVFALDIDDDSIKSCNENCLLNDIDFSKVIIKKSDIFESVNKKADIIIANILPDVLKNVVSDLNDYLNPEGVFIASGIIKEKYELMERILKQENFKVVNKREKGDWVAIQSVRNNV